MDIFDAFRSHGTTLSLRSVRAVAYGPIKIPMHTELATADPKGSASTIVLRFFEVYFKITAPAHLPLYGRSAAIAKDFKTPRDMEVVTVDPIRNVVILVFFSMTSLLSHISD